MRPWVAAALAVVGAAGCADMPVDRCEAWLVSADPAPNEAYFGLDEAAQSAVLELHGTVDGRLAYCSATLLAPDRALTAAHCEPLLAAPDAGLGRGVGRELAVTVVGMALHPTRDAMLLDLSWSESYAASPLGVMDRDLATLPTGARMVAAGYGRTERLQAGARHFSVQRLSMSDEDQLQVQSLAPFGVCQGDSGGPLLALDEDGQVRLAGVLSTSSSNCGGIGRYARADQLLDWLEQQGVDLSGRPQGCGRASEQGLCDGNRASWCQSNADFIAVEDCGGACGWDAAAAGYRCLPQGTAGPFDPCQGVDSLGLCDGSVARRCVDGELGAQDCAECDAACQHSPTSGQAGCVLNEVAP